jgi:hypothetical protein
MPVDRQAAQGQERFPLKPVSNSRRIKETKSLLLSR